MKIREVLRVVFRGLLWALASIITFFLLLYGVEYCCSRIVIGGEGVAGEGVVYEEVEVFVKTNGYHIDIVVPIKNAIIDWSTHLPYSNNISQDVDYSYLALGWGDKGFFLDMPTWDDLTFSLAFKAAFGLSSTALHATYYKTIVEDDDCRSLKISKDQYARLVNYITDSFKLCPEGEFINIKTDAAYGYSDAFYEAKGRYNIFYSCNTWVNNALKECGQKHCLWTFFEKGVMSIY